MRRPPATAVRAREKKPRSRSRGGRRSHRPRRAASPRSCAALLLLFRGARLVGLHFVEELIDPIARFLARVVFESELGCDAKSETVGDGALQAALRLLERLRRVLLLLLEIDAR